MKIEACDNSVKIELNYTEINEFLSIDPYPMFFGTLRKMQKEVEKARLELDSKIDAKLEKAKNWVSRANLLVKNPHEFNLFSNFWMVLYIEEQFKREFSYMEFSITRIVQNKEIIGFELLDSSGNKVESA